MLLLDGGSVVHTDSAVASALAQCGMSHAVRSMRKNQRVSLSAMHDYQQFAGTVYRKIESVTQASS